MVLRLQQRSSMIRLPFLLALVACIVALSATRAFTAKNSIEFVSKQHSIITSTSAVFAVRGGATVVDSDDEEEESEDESEDEDEDEVAAAVDDEEESEDEEEEEEEVAAKLKTVKLASSTVKKAAKTKSKVAASKKASVNKVLKEELKTTKHAAKKKKRGLMKIFSVPYIIRACLNPFTLFAMTKAYWASLCNLDYGKSDDSSQELRSALEAKAKKGPTTGGSKGRRKMKRGQAKTLSDLPALST